MIGKHFLFRLQLNVELGFHTVVLVKDGLLMEDDYLRVNHLAHEMLARPKYIYNINIYLVYFSIKLLTSILGRVSSSLLLSPNCLSPNSGREADRVVLMGLRLYNILE